MESTNFTYLALTITGCFVAIVAAIAGLFAGIGYYRQGKAEAKGSDVDSANSTVKLFENRAKALEVELKDLRNEFEVYKKQTAADFNAYKKEASLKEDTYKKTIEQQETLIKTYAAILQNRNPELEIILKEIKNFLEKLSTVSMHNSKILEDQAKRQISDDAK